MEMEYRNKRLVIWGTGNTGNAFYQKYKDSFPLNTCTSSEEQTKPIEDLDVADFKDLNKADDFIIICSAYHEEIERNLFLNDWIFGQNYITSDFFEANYEREYLGKQLLVSIGRCKIYQIAKTLRTIPAFREKYAMVHFDQPNVCASEKEYNYHKVRQCMEMLKNADILLRPAAVTSKLIADYENLKEKASNKCRDISVSLPLFGSYWPQDTGRERDVAKWYISPFGKNLKAYCERDYILEELIEKGKSKREIIESLSDIKFFDKEKVLCNHRETLKRAYFWDRISDVKITDFIEDSYQDKKLFCDRGHFSDPLLQEYVERILRYLGETECLEALKHIGFESLVEKTGILPGTESLIYPATADALDLKFVNEQTKYRFHLADHTKLVTFREGLEMQIEYYMKARELLKLCYVDNSGL